jgi:hypothetical protein
MNSTITASSLRAATGGWRSRPLSWIAQSLRDRRATPRPLILAPTTTSPGWATGPALPDTGPTAPDVTGMAAGAGPTCEGFGPDPGRTSDSAWSVLTRESLSREYTANLPSIRAALSERMRPHRCIASVWPRRRPGPRPPSGTLWRTMLLGHSSAGQTSRTRSPPARPGCRTRSVLAGEGDPVDVSTCRRADVPAPRDAVSARHGGHGPMSPPAHAPTVSAGLVDFRPSVLE